MVERRSGDTKEDRWRALSTARERQMVCFEDDQMVNADYGSENGEKNNNVFLQ